MQKKKKDSIKQIGLVITSNVLMILHDQIGLATKKKAELFAAGSEKPLFCCLFCLLFRAGDILFVFASSTLSRKVTEINQTSFNFDL